MEGFSEAVSPGQRPFGEEESARCGGRRREGCSRAEGTACLEAQRKESRRT